MTDISKYHSVYSSASEIESELRKRKSDSKLKGKLTDLWRGNIPTFIRSGDQFSYISRPVITPNLETRYFLDIVELFNLEPRFLEFPDKFVSRNREKRFAAKLNLFTQRKDHPGSHSRHHTIVNFHQFEGKPLRNVQTTLGTNLITLHHNVFYERYPHLKNSIIDITDWFEAARVRHQEYYFEYLSLFVCNGVLFENFEFSNMEEYDFFETKVWPSFNRIVEMFGVKPLIFPMVPLKDEMEPLWLSYPTADTTLLEIMRKHEMI